MLLTVTWLHFLTTIITNKYILSFLKRYCKELFPFISCAQAILMREEVRWDQREPCTSSAQQKSHRQLSLQDGKRWLWKLIYALSKKHFVQLQRSFIFLPCEQDWYYWLVFVGCSVVKFLCLVDLAKHCPEREVGSLGTNCAFQGGGLW